MISRHAKYLKAAIDPSHRPATIAWLLGRLRKVDFDAIAVTGISGVTIGSMVAYAMNKELIVVRTPYDNETHSPYRVEMSGKAKSYVIVDDLTSSGRTLQRIYTEIGLRTADWISEEPFKVPTMVCRGIFLYHSEEVYKEDWSSWPADGSGVPEIKIDYKELPQLSSAFDSVNAMHVTNPDVSRDLYYHDGIFSGGVGNVPIVMGKRTVNPLTGEVAIDVESVPT